MLNKILIFIFKALGWKLSGHVPITVSQSIIIVAPHASWVDFPLGLCARAAIRLKISYLGKAELFKPPFGWLFSCLGGYPVDRSKHNNMVDAVVNLFRANQQLHIAIAPEGTRKDVTKLKTGFYYVAKGANIPIIMVGFDYPRKTVFISKPFYPTNNIEADFDEIAKFYNNIEGIQKSWIKETIHKSIK
ncbi:1-acyl-sn-glycerol-3-phosphate acyltransferase [Flectobacillus major]|jgi:1-acyl-sn-glycerol-3-phosphate acyltransferase|uniref:1-acyl-sn-glycerol-3-phosphate acyltransferase n=1 Tax=Flectobacillus major TaxID=103 RepID=UPI00047A8297|nr:1-acyl-sn-glycerol-3-phosphate acyltransferase [Flectobacillus major]